MLDAVAKKLKPLSASARAAATRFAPQLRRVGPKVGEAVGVATTTVGERLARGRAGLVNKTWLAIGLAKLYWATRVLPWLGRVKAALAGNAAKAVSAASARKTARVLKAVNEVKGLRPRRLAPRLPGLRGKKPWFPGDITDEAWEDVPFAAPVPARPLPPPLPPEALKPLVPDLSPSADDDEWKGLVAQIVGKRPAPEIMTSSPPPTPPRASQAMPAVAAPPPPEAVVAPPTLEAEPAAPADEAPAPVVPAAVVEVQAAAREAPLPGKAIPRLTLPGRPVPTLVPGNGRTAATSGTLEVASAPAPAAAAVTSEEESDWEALMAQAKAGAMEATPTPPPLVAQEPAPVPAAPVTAEYPPPVSSPPPPPAPDIYHQRDWKNPAAVAKLQAFEQRAREISATEDEWARQLRRSKQRKAAGR